MKHLLQLLAFCEGICLYAQSSRYQPTKNLILILAIIRNDGLVDLTQQFEIS